ncbi:MAG: sigma-70 family RNA polymerase sigma factor [Sedimentisphaerales bacterium]|nr:sigma-70 family RNA polymerase sigma factor [Sedimentisphaerales bacterium]
MGSIDPGQLGGWFDAYGPRLALYARQWLDAALAEDVVQEVFIRLMAQAEPPANIQGWLFRSVRNGSISQLRRQIRRKHYTRVLATDRRNWFESQPGDLLDARNAQQALLDLPVEQREIVILRIWGQMTLREIAEIVEKPVSTVHHSYQSALQSLRTKMKAVPGQI